MKEFTLLFCITLAAVIGYCSLNHAKLKKLTSEPVVTAKKFIEYKKANGHLNDFTPPKIVLVCYQSSTLMYLLSKNQTIKPSADFSSLYFVGDGQVAILSGMGIGAPALAIKIEELIALGVTKFIAVGTAGTLNNHHPGSFIISAKALAEDGVAHHYLQANQKFTYADKQLIAAWENFAKIQSLPAFEFADAWSFSAIFKESTADIIRVKKEDCGVVEMEAATLYAIGQEKGVQTLSLFVVSDVITLNEWTPHIKEPIVKDNLHKLAEWALDFCQINKS